MKNIMKKFLGVLFSFLFCIPFLNAQLQYQFKGVGDDFVDGFASDVIADMIKESRFQADETLVFILTYEQKSLKISYSGEKSAVSGTVQKDEADLFSDLEETVRQAVSKSLSEVEAAVRQKEKVVTSAGKIGAADETDAVRNVVDTPKEEAAPPVVNDRVESVHVNNNAALSQNTTNDNSSAWQKIRNFMMAPRNKSDKIVSLKQAGKLSTYTTLKSGLMVELTDEGILKIKGSGCMLSEDRAVLKPLCPYVIAIEVDEGITEVAGFQNFASVEYVLLPSTIRKIAQSAFMDCIKLVEINIPASTLEIGASAFQNCGMLSALVLPNTLQIIGNKAFFDCVNLKEINLPSSISVISAAVFRNCKSLEKIEIPSSVTHIKEFAFRNCRSISSLNLSDNVLSIEKGCFQDMVMLSSLRISENIVLIPSSAFESCISLNSIVVPQKVQAIGDYAFKDCRNMVEITFLSDNMRSLGKDCLEDCLRLSTINLYSQYPPICLDLFSDKKVPQRIIVKVPNSAVSIYLKSDFWKLFTIQPL